MIRKCIGTCGKAHTIQPYKVNTVKHFMCEDCKRKRDKAASEKFNTVKQTVFEIRLTVISA